MISSLVFSLLVAPPSLAFAGDQDGIKEGNGDAPPLFICASLPNADSPIRIVGSGSVEGRLASIVINFGQDQSLDDSGILGSGRNAYIGKIFDIEFGAPAKLVAKAATPVMNAGDTISLNCAFAELR